MKQRSIKRLDEAFEHMLTSMAVDAKQSDLTEKKRAERRRRADADEFEFCKIYYPGIFSDEFNALHKHIRSLKTGNHTVGGSRKFGKSAYTFTAKLIRDIALGIPGMTGIVMHTQEDAIERSASIKRIIERNKLLCYDYSINTQQDKKGWYIINNVQLIAVGVREGLRNLIDDEFKRFRLLILDDLYNRSTVASPAMNERIYNFVTSEAWGQMEQGGLSIWLFNYISSDSPGSRIAAEYPEAHFNLPALNANDETNWPESSIYTTEYFHTLRKNIPLEVWQGDYMNEPALHGDILKIEWVTSINPISVKLNTVLIAIDPSFGTSPSACSKGAALMGYTSDNRYILLDIFIRKDSYKTLFTWCYDNMQRYREPFRIILFENDFAQWQLAEQSYLEWTRETKKLLPLLSINSKDSKTEHFGSDKFNRILNLAHPYQTGRLVHSSEIPKSEDLKQYLFQYVGFGKSKTKLDGLDAAATAYIRMMQFVQNGVFEPVKTIASKTNDWLNDR